MQQDTRVVIQPGEEFLDRIREALAAQAPVSVIIDLHRVTAVDAHMLQGLRAAGKIARAAGARLVIEGASAGVYKALHVANLSHLFVAATGQPERVKGEGDV